MLLNTIVFSQINENFADGDFTANPAWSGNTDLFTISGNQLKSNITAANTFYLSTPSTIAGNAQWEIFINQRFDVNSTNFCEVYLMSNNQNLTSTGINGYFVKAGNTNNEVSLYKSTGGTATTIISVPGILLSTSNNNVKIRVKRDASNLWTLETSISGGNYTLQGSITDATHSTSSFFGVKVRENAAGNFSKTFIDDINVGPILVDNTAPFISTVIGLNTSVLGITFSEPVSIASAINLSNYITEIGNPIEVAVSGANVNLTFGGSFMVNQNYNITINGIHDLAGNVITVNSTIGFMVTQTTTSPVTTTSPIINFRDIVINEIMADPNPVAGLPDAEYIEVYNRTNLTVNLQGFKLRDYTSTGTFTTKIITGSFVIAPNSFGILCGTSAKSLLVALNTGAPVFDFSSLSPSEDDRFELVDANDNVIDKVTYKEAWMKNSKKADGGYSLEQINPNSPCPGELNWAASINVLGGTPGTVNSILNTVVENTPPVFTGTRFISPSQFVIGFSEQMDSISVLSASFSFSGNAIQSFSVVRPNYDSVSISLISPMVAGNVYTLIGIGPKDCVGNILTPNTIGVGLGKAPVVNEVVINEILVDESPSVGLPDAEFIELYNSSSSLLDISNYILYDATSSAVIPRNTTMLPKSYLILCATTNASKFAGFGKTVGVPGFPSLNNTGEELGLKNNNQNIISSISYNMSWYKDDPKEDGGYSIERINATKNCGSKSNWMASVAAIGGTPGAINSVSILNFQGAIPTLVATKIVNSTTVSMIFTEAINPFSITSLTGIFIPPNNSIVGKNIIGSNSDTLYLRILYPIDTGKTYQISVTNLQDCSDRTISPITQAVGIGKKPLKEEVVINEILADENPKVGLPEAEFVELFNTTDNLIDLTGSRLYDASGRSSAFPATTLIQPKGFLILCSTSRPDDFKPYGNTLGVPSFPSLNSTDETLSLVNASGVTLSKVTYSDTWYKDEVKKDGGWTLERVDPLNPCGTANNWTSSINVKGGTPGVQNSIYAKNPDEAAPLLSAAFAIAPDTMVVYFNEPLDSISAVNAFYSVSNDINIQSKKVFLDYITFVVSPVFVPKTIYSFSVSNLRDCAGNIIKPNTTASFFLAEQADSLDIIVNEVLFNPKTFGSDFVEIYNNSAKYINLKNWSLANLNDSGKVSSLKNILAKDHIIAPRAFRVLTDSKLRVSIYYTKYADSVFIELPTLPSFNDDEGNVLIINNKKRISDFFHYKDDYHFKLIEKKDGVSLERIDYKLPTNTPESWQSASSTIGYATPGFQNSQYQKVENNGNTISIDPKVFTPDEDGWRDFTVLSYNFSTPGNTANITIYDSQGREAKKLVQNHLLGTYGTYQWDGLDNNGNKVSTGYYLVIVEIFDLKGTVNSYKESVVVGAKF